MHFFLGADHQGMTMKNIVKQYLMALDYPVEDCGAYEYDQTDDYPDFARIVATKVAKTPGSSGVLICGTGIGMSIAANKVPGAYAALVDSAEMARLARLHNNANILCMGAMDIDEAQVQAILESWLSYGFDPNIERHFRRMRKIVAIEKGNQ